MTTDTSEKVYQKDIYTYLESTGYVKRTTKDYNIVTCLDIELVLNFIQFTQPKGWKKFEKVYKEKAPEKFIKSLVKNIDKLKQLGFEITLHDKMPDVVLYRPDEDWLYFIEAFTSRGPMDPKRIMEIDEMTPNVKSGKIYVTAFLDFNTYKSHSHELAWETEVWLAEMPDHMIHLNGDKFLGPR